MNYDIVTQLRKYHDDEYLSYRHVLQAADEIERLRDERDKWQLMAADLGEHLENALYSDEWKTREYAIVAFAMFEKALPHWRKGRNLESDF